MLENWRDLLQAIKEKKQKPDQYQKAIIGSIYIDNLLKTYERKKTIFHKERILKNYYLNEPFNHIYFTQREIECLNLLKKGLTNRATGELLGLSERTIEFYIRNMREKTGCTSKQALLEKMREINFTEKTPPAKTKNKKNQYLKHKNTNDVSSI